MFYLSVGFLSAVVVGVAGIAVAVGWNELPRNGWAEVRFLVFAAALPVVFLGFLAYGRLRLDSAYRRRVGAFQPQETTIDPDGFEALVHGSSARYEWLLFDRFKIDAEVVILFATDGGWIYFARSRFVSDADWDRFVDFVRDHDWSA